MLQVGQVLRDRYQLKEQLGQNAGRQTWLANDLAQQPPEPVIVKLLAFGDQVQWDNLKLFEREAHILKQLNHPQIPKYRDYFSIDDRILWFGLVQNYIPGSSLKQLLTQGRRFSEEEVRKIATDVLQILIYLHQLSPAVLHRDIKPSNLILGEDEKIYLVDFGAVQDRAATEGATFTVVGTYGYAPMEQFGGRAVPASDLYALGATLIHLLTGTSPADLPQRNMRIQFSDRVSLKAHFVRWIEGLTEPDVERRLSTAHQALDALNSRHISHAFLPVHQPYGSQIVCKKSPSQLDIKIPGRGIQASDTFLLFFVLIWYGGTFPIGLLSFNAIVLLFWIAGLLPLGMVILPAFGEIDIHFCRDSFVVKWKLLGRCYRQLYGKTATIHRVRQSDESITINGNPLATVVLQAGVQEYKFGAVAPPLAELERDWLVKEIKEWLGI